MVVRNRFPKTARAADGASAPDRAQARSKARGDDPWTALKKAWRALGKRLPELKEDLSCYAAVQVDRVRLSASRVLIGAAYGILAVIAAAAVLFTAVSFLIAGIAGGIASALGGNVWLANLITGAAVLVSLASAVAIGLRIYNGKRRRRLEQRYKRYEARQFAMDHPDVPDRRPHAQ